MGIKTDSVAAYLGVDYAAGCRRRATKVKTRWTAIHNRTGRVRIAQKARGLAHKVVGGAWFQVSCTARRFAGWTTPCSRACDA